MHTFLSLLPENGPPAGPIPGKESSILLFVASWVLFGLVNEIPEKLTGDADFVGVDTYLPGFLD